MPIVAVEDVRRHRKAPAALQSCASEQQEAPMFVRVAAIETGAVVQHGTVDEIRGNVRAGKAGRLQREAVFRVAYGQRDLLRAEDGLQLRVRRPNRGVQGHEGVHFVAQLPEALHQSACDVCESAGLCERQDLRTQDTKLQCRHS